jgi:hypothetical protein
VHIPKTGGSFTKDTLKNYGINVLEKSVENGKKSSKWPFCMGHYTFNGNTDTKFGELPEWKKWVERKNCFFFTIVRNPYDLLVSWYYHGDGKSGWQDAAKLIEAYTFDEFVEKYCNWEFHFKDFERCVFDQLFDATGHYVPEITIRNEFLNSGLEQTLRGCGLVKTNEAIRWPPRKYSKHRAHRDWRSYYTDKTAELVAKKCKFELEVFGYTFDGPTNQEPIISPRSRIKGEW